MNQNSTLHANCRKSTKTSILEAGETHYQAGVDILHDTMECGKVSQHFVKSVQERVKEYSENESPKIWEPKFANYYPEETVRFMLLLQQMQTPGGTIQQKESGSSADERHQEDSKFCNLETCSLSFRYFSTIFAYPIIKNYVGGSDLAGRRQKNAILPLRNRMQMSEKSMRWRKNVKITQSGT